MKLHPSFVVLYSSLLLSSQALGNGFMAQSGPPTIKHSLELQQYVNTIASYHPETAALNERLKKTIAYYQKTHILKSVNRNNYTVDCIPFAEQPALIDNPGLAQELLPTVMRDTKNNLDTLIQAGNNFEFNPATECPLGSVAILRPSERILTSEMANNKVAPGSPKDPANMTQSGYTWEQGVDPNGNNIYIVEKEAQAFFKSPQRQYVSSNYPGDHSLNQFWYSNENARRTSDTYTVEFGIIASAYFTIEPTTSIFVFASVDGYGNNSCYNLSCPNFVQAPGTTPIGVPITNLMTDFIFQLKHLTRPGMPAGYYLTLVSHNTSSSNQPSLTTFLGFYPESLYPKHHHPAEFSAGAEVSATEPADGTVMYGNLANPYAGYLGPKMIGIYSQIGNLFPYSYGMGPAPYGVIWKLGQS